MFVNIKNKLFFYCFLAISNMLSCYAGNVYWYSENDIEISQNLIQKYNDVVDGIILCCGVFSVSEFGIMEMDDKQQNEVIKHLKTFPNKNFYILGVTGAKSFSKNITTLETQKEFVNKLQTLQKSGNGNFKGLIMDFEPAFQLGKSTQIAHDYNNWLNLTKTFLKSKNIEMGMDTSQSSALSKYNIYKTSNLDVYTSMSTYSNRFGLISLWINKLYVNNQLKNFNNNNLRIGIGSILKDGKNRWGWSNYTLTNFLNYIKEKQIQGVDIWRQDIDDGNKYNQADFFIDALKSYKN